MPIPWDVIKGFQAISSKTATARNIAQNTGTIPFSFIVFSATAIPSSGKKEYTYFNAGKSFSGIAG